ncbi:MAG: hypothetical protein EXR50_03060 [Dehalococcoidia bacterium]|nr:hypothetical protein [Dehalococcoidia bacterium]
MEVGSIIRDVFTGGPQEIICDRIHSLWTARFNVWRGLPLSSVLGGVLQVPLHLRNHRISYTICTKDDRLLMGVDLFAGDPSPQELEACGLSKQAGIPIHYIILPDESPLHEGYHINLVDSVITSTVGAGYAAEEHLEYEMMQQPFLNHVAVEMPGEGSSPMILDWYGGDEVDATMKYDPLTDHFQRLHSAFIGSDRGRCPWGLGALSCTIKVNTAVIDLGHKEGMLGRSTTVSTHLGDAASGPIWVSEFDNADIIASRLAGILAFGKAISLIKK